MLFPMPLLISFFILHFVLILFSPLRCFHAAYCRCHAAISAPCSLISLILCFSSRHANAPANFTTRTYDAIEAAFDFAALILRCFRASPMLIDAICAPFRYLFCRHAACATCLRYAGAHERMPLCCRFARFTATPLCFSFSIPPEIADCFPPFAYFSLLFL